MTTHQNDWQRMAFMAWALGKYNIVSFVETGIHEGETIGYFSKFVKFAWGCDLNQESLDIAKQRYPHIYTYKQDARDFLKQITPIADIFFYLDCTWGEYLHAKEQLPIIYKKWKNPIVFVSGMIVNNGSKGQQPLEDLKPYGKVIIPKYYQSNDMSGYALIVPDMPNLPNNWEIL